MKIYSLIIFHLSLFLSLSLSFFLSFLYFSQFIKVDHLFSNSVHLLRLHTVLVSYLPRLVRYLPSHLHRFLLRYQLQLLHRHPAFLPHPYHQFHLLQPPHLTVLQDNHQASRQVSHQHSQPVVPVLIHRDQQANPPVNQLVSQQETPQGSLLVNPHHNLPGSPPRILLTLLQISCIRGSQYICFRLSFSTLFLLFFFHFLSFLSLLLPFLLLSPDIYFPLLTAMFETTYRPSK